MATETKTGHSRNGGSAKRDRTVMELVEQALKSDREMSTEELYERAKKVNPAMKNLTLRQFNARYPLQVKRKLAREDGGRTQSLGIEGLEHDRLIGAALGGAMLGVALGGPGGALLGGCAGLVFGANLNQIHRPARSDSVQGGDHD
ncbi:MAG: hypothetical protein Q8W44_03260 [Candidatus Palauibacterales bacterium]|nr:hypothetical protein [Candidatus Palauibacterales bacterium]